MRRAISQGIRARSQAQAGGRREAIIDVNNAAVVETMRRCGVRLLLHGHTHRPGIHEFTLDGHGATRIVLGDWYTQGSVLHWSSAGFALRTLPYR